MTISLFTVCTLLVLSFVLIAVRGSTNAPNVVIVGAGVGGTSCAYFISKDVPGAKIVLLEAQADVGGRIKDVSFWNLTVNLGAGVFNVQQRYIAQLAKDMNLTVGTYTSKGFPNVYVWDEANLTTTEELFTRHPGAEVEMQGRLEGYLTAVRNTYNEYEKSNTEFDSVPNYLKAGGLDEYTNQSASMYFSGGSTPVSRQVQDYAIDILMRSFFGQGLESQCLLSMVCLEGYLQNAFYIDGGMSKLVQALVASSGADLQLESRVTKIKKLNANEYEVLYTKSGVDMKMVADTVVIAAPLEWTGIQFEGFDPDPSTTQPVRQWQQLYTYVSYVAAQSIRNSYFKEQPRGNWTDPVPLFTTANASVPWVTVSKFGSRGGFTIYQVTSSTNVSAGNLLNNLFDGVQDVITQKWDHLYSLNLPSVANDSAYQSLVLDDNVYSLNGIESVASQMEMSVISGRNAAGMIAKGTASSGVILTSSPRIFSLTVLTTIIYSGVH